MKRCSPNNGLRVFLAASLFISCCLLSGCSHPERYIVAEVNGKKITADDFKNELKIYPFNKDSVNNRSEETKFLEIKKELLNSMIREKILLDQAEKNDISVAEGELSDEISKVQEDYGKTGFLQYLKERGIDYNYWTGKMRSSIAIRKLTERVTGEIKGVKESEIAEYYESNKPEFTMPDEIHAFQIVVKTEEEAYKIYNEIKRGAKFEDLAKTYSISPEGKNGGDLGYFSKDSMPLAFGDTLIKLGQGSISRVTASEYGYHIFKVAEKRASRILPLSEVRDRIAAELMRQKKDALFSDWFKERIAKADIKRNNVLLATLK